MRNLVAPSLLLLCITLFTMVIAASYSVSSSSQLCGMYTDISGTFPTSKLVQIVLYQNGGAVSVFTLDCATWHCVDVACVPVVSLLESENTGDL